MVHRPAYVYNGSGWDEIGDSRLASKADTSHDHSGGSDGPNIPQSSVTNLTSDLATKLPISGKGNIVQIVRATDSVLRTTTSTSFVDLTAGSLWVTISPQSSSNSLILLGSLRVTVSSNLDRGIFQITDSSNNAISGAEDLRVGILDISGSGSPSFSTQVTLIAYATPATSSGVTYKMRFRSEGGASVAVRNADMTAQFYALEISA